MTLQLTKIFNTIINSSLRCDLRILSDSDTLKCIKDNKVSFIRWGDGESALLRGKSIPCQVSSLQLSQDLARILMFTIDGNYLLGVPSIFFNQKISNILTFNYWRNAIIWKSTHLVLKQNLDKNQVVGDAFLFRPPGRMNISDVVCLWSGMDVVLVSSNSADVDLLIKISNPLCVHHIMCKKVNAYENLKNYSDKINNYVRIINPKKLVLLFAAGPVGKVLAMEYSRNGFYCLDVGNFFDLKCRSMATVQV